MHIPARPVLAVLPLGVLLFACDDPVTEPPAADEVLIVARTTGGIAGMDWTVTLDGSAGELRCEGSCPWDGGNVRMLTDLQVEEIATAFVDAGVRTKRSTDYGVCGGCADQFHHVVDYRDGRGAYEVEGDGPNLPDRLKDALNRVIFPPPPPE